jgi:CubicO group peptidase (beta-lactamase class C family)
MLPFFSDYEITNVDERRERITIEDLLTMRAGMFWDEVSAPYMSPENDVYYILTGDGVDHCLNLDMVAEPGELWHYSGGASHLLAAIVQVATGTDFLDFADEHLFSPLGIDDYYWTHDGSRNWQTGACLEIIRAMDISGGHFQTLVYIMQREEMVNLSSLFQMRIW